MASDVRSDPREIVRPLLKVRQIRQFTDEPPSTAYFPIAIFNRVPDFQNGTIVTRFAIVGGDTDTEAGIFFNYQPNGDFKTATLHLSSQSSVPLSCSSDPSSQ